MSAPDKSLNKQKKRHWGPLVGISLAVIVALSLLVWWLGRELVTEPTENGEVSPATIEGTRGLPAEGAFTEPGGTGAPQVIEQETPPAD